MAARPTYIDVRSQSHGPLGNGSASIRPQTCPRVHLVGEVPPELSPLDAFAAQSRLLFKQLEKSSSGGRRISRLPPLTIEQSFNIPRPGYVRSVSADDVSGSATQMSPIPACGLKTDHEDETSRPVSIYPRLSRVLHSGSIFDRPQTQGQAEEHFRGRKPHTPMPDFGTRREHSPESFGNEGLNIRQDTSPSYFATRPSIGSMRQRAQDVHRPRDTSTASRGYGNGALAPPRSPFAQRTSSMRSNSVDGSDDDYSTSISASYLSESRKFSFNNGIPKPPASPFLQSIPRSSSVSSDISTAGNRLSRPTFNFSRPLSRAGEPPPEFPSRQASADSQPFVLADDTLHTPVSIHSEDFSESGNISPGASSYVYSRFSLPRGKILQRNSKVFEENKSLAELHPDQSTVPYSSAQPFASDLTTSPPSPPSRPSTSSLGKASSRNAVGSPEVFPLRASEDHSRVRNDHARHTDRSRPASSVGAIRPHTASVSNGTLLKARGPPSVSHSADCSAEEHVAKGIELHELGSLNESTYHLRIAARQNHPTGMLLYALACRHGWGMRPNQREGVQWLRKAADSAFLEVADDEDLIKGGKSVDFLEQRTRKAQFALSIYELGVSHMNGWGIEQDKVLALRCFEIAGCERSRLWQKATR
jgi:hypothetical protein